ncbi:MAG TPA: alpha/beta hydrolase [Thermoanaerobaculia bacterium]|jgi:pimeloyl-ACP methyl ester carboxylesterase
MFKRILACAVVVALAGWAGAEEIALKSGVTVHYDVAGPKDAPPLLLLHGLGDTKRSWSLVTPELAKTHRVYAIDQRGHGKSSSPVCCYAQADLAYDAVSFMDAMKIERAAVVGHSLGSFVAQHLAAQYPQRVSRVVLIGSGRTTAGTEIIEWLWEQVRGVETRVGSEFVDAWQSNPNPVDEEFLRHVKRETADVRPHVWKSIARALMADQSRLLREIEAPVLIVWGDKDPGFLADNQAGLRNALRNAEFKAYPNMGHNPHWEIPARIAADLRAFLEVQETGESRMTE